MIAIISCKIDHLTPKFGDLIVLNSDMIVKYKDQTDYKGKLILLATTDKNNVKIAYRYYNQIVEFYGDQLCMIDRQLMNGDVEVVHIAPRIDDSALLTNILVYDKYNLDYKRRSITIKSGALQGNRYKAIYDAYDKDIFIKRSDFVNITRDDTRVEFVPILKKYD